MGVPAVAASVMLTGDAAVVTGAASGNGRAIARRFAEAGADVVVADVIEEPREGGRPTADLISAETDRSATFVECDVADRDDLATAVDAAEAFGGVDVMVNNAGVFGPEAFLETTEDEYDQLMDINAKGVFFGSQLAARRMAENDGGSIINLSSQAGLEGAGAHVTYSASKGAVRLMTYAMADALGDEGIRVNAIHPGAIETKMLTEDVPVVGTEEAEMVKAAIPSGRFGTPEDVADAALYLASDLSEYVNGTSLTVDGGQTNTA
jgi:NAD(P)-dependent dehydrogenase (short-subunit alcohol dehydrogenase family)